MKIIAIGSSLAGIAVILGAFGAHGLRGKIESDLLEIFQTACHYLMLHAIAIILYGLWIGKKNFSPTTFPWPVVCFILGSLIFSGSLFCIVFSGIRQFGMLTPIGGLLFIFGWFGFAWQSLKEKS